MAPALAMGGWSSRASPSRPPGASGVACVGTGAGVKVEAPGVRGPGGGWGSGRDKWGPPLREHGPRPDGGDCDAWVALPQTRRGRVLALMKAKAVLSPAPAGDRTAAAAATECSGSAHREGGNGVTAALHKTGRGFRGLCRVARRIWPDAGSAHVSAPGWGLGLG